MDPRALVIRNMLTLRRLGNGVASDVADLLRELFDDIAGLIVAVDVMAVAEIWRQARVERLMERIRERAGEKYAEIYKYVRQSVAEVGAQQSEWSADVLQQAVGDAAEISKGEVGINAAKALIDGQPIEGDMMSQSFDTQEGNVVTGLRRIVQQGVADGDSMDAIVRAVRGDAFDGSRRQAEIMVRTAINDISNEAHMATYRANEDVVDEVQFVATLDSRTTYECAAHDGKVYAVDDPDLPQPPLHWGCRSILVPVVNWKALGIEPPADGQRASMGGPVSAGTDYEAWLNDQSQAVQDEALGPARAELFRGGKIKLRDLINTDGDVVRVADL